MDKTPTLVKEQCVDMKQSMVEPEEKTYLLNEIITITKDPKSKSFWLKAINALGESRVESELGELKYQLKTGTIEYPAKYLTTLLQKQMKKQGNETLKNNTKGEKLKTYFEDTQLTLFKNLHPIKLTGEVEQHEMLIPYGKTKIPWTTFLGPSFFTLSSNKAKSDKVLAKFRTLDGDVSIIPMVRGRVSPGGKERGILTAQHAKILAALKHIWATQGSSFYRYPNGAKACHCYVSIRELAKLFDWKKFGGRDLNWLKDMIYDLKVVPYYLDLTGLGIKELTGYGFSLLEKITLVEGKRHGQSETVFHIEFSVPISVQLLDKHAVTKSTKMLTVHSDLATLLQLYLEPILISLNGQEYSKQLKDIITDLQLPKSDWHKKASRRKIIFEKAVKGLSGYHTANSGKMLMRIEKGLFDYMLTARVEQSHA